MDKILYIGGYFGARSHADHVAETLAETEFNFDDPLGVTFSDALNSPEMVAKMAEGRAILTHSAGALALKAMRKEAAKISEVHMLAPPLRSSMGGLAVGTVAKTGYSVFNTTKNPQRIPAFGRYFASSISEGIAHPLTYAKAVQSVAEFDAIFAARTLNTSGVPAAIGRMSRDAYFRWTDYELTSAAHDGTKVVKIDGEHDEISFDTRRVLKNYFNKAA